MYTSDRDYTSKNKSFQENIKDADTSLSAREVKNDIVIPQIMIKNSHQKKNYTYDIDKEYATRGKQTNSSYYDDLLPLVKVKGDDGISTHYKSAATDSRNPLQDPRNFENIKPKNSLSVGNLIKKKMDFGGVNTEDITSKAVGKNSLNNMNLMRKPETQVKISPIVPITQQRNRLIVKK